MFRMAGPRNAQGRVLICGGGIGGLTAALCLARAGFRVRIFEQAPAFAEVGAGIQISPNGARVLHHLGLAPGLANKGCRPQRTEFRHWRTGKVISASPLGESVQQAYGFPYYHLHRADLLQLLYAAAEQDGRIELHLGSKMQGLAQDGDRVCASTTEDDGTASVREGDVLVGADGIHSTVRTALFGRDAPSFTGNLAWRALVPAERLPAGLIAPATTAWWGPHKHFVHYYVRSGALVNCVCVVEKTGWTVESWTEPGAHEELKVDFAGWHPIIHTLIDQMQPATLHKWALHDRWPMRLWGKGRVTLLGDACHPTLPFMAQGANMAIEDAAVLASCLAQGGDAPTGLRRYEDLRRKRTARVQEGSRRNARLFHLSGAAAWLRNRAARRAGGRLANRLFSYDALTAAD